MAGGSQVLRTADLEAARSAVTKNALEADHQATARQKAGKINVSRQLRPEARFFRAASRDAVGNTCKPAAIHPIAKRRIR
jgi:hypothetical protein